MLVRFFGGWEFADSDSQNRLPANVGYTKGVPMGADLPTAPPGVAPTFLVAALKDPLSGNLDRIQIVKGWLDATGSRQEQVYDIAWSGDRAPGSDGKLPPVGDTVDVDEHDRRPRDHHGVDRSGLRSGAARYLLCTGARDPDAPLDGL